MKRVKIGPNGAVIRLKSGATQHYKPNKEYKVTEEVAELMKAQKCDVSEPKETSKGKG